MRQTDREREREREGEGEGEGERERERERKREREREKVCAKKRDANIRVCDVYVSNSPPLQVFSVSLRISIDYECLARNIVG